MAVEQRVFPVGVLDGHVVVLRSVIGKLTRDEALTLAADLIVMVDCIPIPADAKPADYRTDALAQVVRLVQLPERQG